MLFITYSKPAKFSFFLSVFVFMLEILATVVLGASILNSCRYFPSTWKECSAIAFSLSSSVCQMNNRNDG